MIITTNESFKDFSDVLSVKDLQKMLKIGRSSAYGLLKTGKIQTVKIGRKYIITKKSVIEFLNN